MTQLTIPQASKKYPVSIQSLLGGRFVRVTIYGTIQHKLVVTHDQAIALAEAMAFYYFGHNPNYDSNKTNTRKQLKKNRANH